MFRFALVLTIILILICTGAALSDSLWTISSPSLFADIKAKQVGDLVTVVISEGAESSLKASTDLSKDLDHSNQAGVGPFVKLLPEIAVKSGQKSSASGQTTIASKLAATVTAKVIQVLPNGNLQIQAQRMLETNSEKQEITLTGTVRPQDIGSDNTVLSTYVSDIVVKYSGKGAIGDRQKEGLLTKIVKYIF